MEAQAVSKQQDDLRRVAKVEEDVKKETSKGRPETKKETEKANVRILTMDLTISENVVDRLQILYKLSKEEIKTILSTPPKSVTLRVNTKLVSTNEARDQLAEYLKDLQPKPFEIKFNPQTPDVLFVLPLNFENQPQALTKEVIVDASCGAAVLRGADIFVPGVLAANSTVLANDSVSIYCDVDKKCRKGFTKHFGGRKYFLGNGKARFSRWQLFEKDEKNDENVCGVAIQMTECKYNLPSFGSLDHSMFFPQNLPSVIVGHLIDVELGGDVLDMCAAPGGKSTHLATLLGKQGTLVSIDKTPKKVDRIKENLKKLQLDNVKCFCFDSTKLLDDTKERSKEESIDQPPFPRHSFDRILLDPPCSGLGQRPQLKYSFTDKELSSYPILQKKFFKQAVPLLKPGGTLIFSTCTLLPEENEVQVAWVLSTFPEMKLVAQDIRIGNVGLAGYGLNEENRSKVQRFDTVFNKSIQLDQFNDTIGFFVAKFLKDRKVT